jgi:hypothetical protein
LFGPGNALGGIHIQGLTASLIIFKEKRNNSMNNGTDSSAATALSMFTLVYCIVVLAIVAFTIFVFWRIFKKTGQNGAMSLIALIPGIGTIIVLCILAFGKWPIEIEVEQHRMMRGGVLPPPAAPDYSGYPPQQSQPQPPYAQYPSPPPYPPQYP